MSAMIRTLLLLLLLGLSLLAGACGSSNPLPAASAQRAVDSLSLHVLAESFIGADSSAAGFTLSSRVSGDELIVEISADEARDLRALYYGLDYDPALLSPLAAAPDARFAEADEVLSLLVPTGRGQLSAGQVLIHPADQAGFSGSGTVATLHFALQPDPQLRESSRVNIKASATPLELAWNNADKQLGWYYNNPADYDQNGEVNVADLTPLAVHFGASLVGGFPVSAVESVVDGDGNGLINLADITPIGVNFGNAGSGGYDIFEVVGGVDTQIGSMPLSLATGDKSSERLRFIHSPAAPTPGKGFYVRLNDGLGNLGFAPDPVFVPNPVDNPPFIVLDFLDRPTEGNGSEASPWILTDAIIGNTFHFQVTDESVNVTGQAGVEIRSSNAGATLSIDQATGEVQFDPAFSESPFYLDGVSAGVDTQNRLYFNYIPEPKVEIFIMPDPADTDWASVSGDGLSQPTAYVIATSTFNVMGTVEFSFIANTKADGSGDPIDVSTLTWDSNVPAAITNAWDPPGSVKFRTNLTDLYVFAKNGDGVESNHVFCIAKILGG